MLKRQLYPEVYKYVDRAAHPSNKLKYVDLFFLEQKIDF